MIKRFTTEITPSDIENIVKCPLCNSENFLPISQVFLKETLLYCETVFCTSCSFLFRSKRPAIEWFYKYWEIEEEASTIRLVQENQRYQRYLRIAKICEEKMPVGSVLDIGSSTGYGLKSFLDRSWKVCGIEADKSRTKISKSLGIETISESIENVDQIQMQSFDLVLLIETLEHFHHPKEFLLKISKQVKNEGFLYVEVPDFKNYAVWGDALYWKHMQLFNKYSLNKILTDLDFTPVKWYKPKTQPHSDNHISVLAKKIHKNDTNVIPKLTINEVKKKYIRLAKNELKNTTFPIKYTVDSLRQDGGIGRAPKLNDNGFFKVEEISKRESMIRGVMQTSKRMVLMQILKKISKGKLKDRQFERIYEYE